MRSSVRNARVTELTGIRQIMADIASLGADTAGGSVDLGAGNPAALAPVAATWRGLTAGVVDDSFEQVCTRYGSSRGTGELVAAVIDYFNGTYGWSIRPDNVVVGPGSQMIAYALATLHTSADEGGRRRLLLPRSPEYAGFGRLDLATGGGMVTTDPVVVEEGARRFRYRINTDAVAACDDVGMMLVSDPSNPSGTVLGPDESATLAELSRSWDVPLVVDHAYGAPFPRIVDGARPPRLDARTVNLFTFSKMGLPAERIAFAVGPSDLIDGIVGFFANSMLHAPQLLQVAAARALTARLVDRMVDDHIAPCYRVRRALAERLLEEHMPRDVRWRLHDGRAGIFCWLHVDEEWFDDLGLYTLLKDEGVFVVPGRYFFLSGSDSAFGRTHARRCVRLSLSTTEGALDRGLRRFASGLARYRRSVA